MRLLLNTVADRVPVATDGDPLAFHRRLPGYEVTPLVDAAAIARDLGLGHVWVKDESSRLGLPAFKMLGASWATYRAVTRRLGIDPEPWATVEELADRLGAPGLRLVAATDGNHGRAVARTAKLLRLDATIVVPADMVPARRDAIRGEGAELVVVDGTYDDAVRRSAELASDRCLVISDTSWAGYTDVPGWVIDAYSTIFREVDEQLDGRPLDAVVVQLGVGALGAAVARHHRRPGRWLLGVEPSSAACVTASVAAGRAVEVPGPHDSIMAGLNCGVPSLLALPELAAGIDAFVTVEDDDARAAMRALASVGIVAGETGASGLAGLAVAREASGLDPDASVLVLCTEGATDPAAYAGVVPPAP